MSKTNIKNHLFGKVAVLMGGRSAEREISLKSGHAVLKALLSQGVDAHAFDTAEKDLFLLKTEKFNACFIALHGRYGEDGTIQGLLEILGIPYTGSGVMASSIAMNKIMTKNIWRSKGLPTPNWIEATCIQDTRTAFENFGGLMVVKPALEGSSIGITKVETLAQCELAFDLASLQDSKVICEQFISGDEVTCTILEMISDLKTDDSENNNNKINQSFGKNISKALPIIKIIAPSGKYDYKNKYFTNDTKYIIPSELPGSEEANIQSLVVTAFQAIDARGWGRVDVMIDKQTRKPYLLEINTAPGMTDHSLSPMSALHAGLNFEKLCLQILSTASLDYKTIYNTNLIV
jgi:D-alanine-D-alanine ligase